MITVVSADMTILYQTESGANALGCRAEDLVGTKFVSLVDPEHVLPLRAACAEAADGIKVSPVELRLACADGSWIDAETVVSFHGDEGCFVLTTRDIGDRKRAQRQAALKSRQQDVVASLGAKALAGAELEELMAATAIAVSEVLETEFVGVYEWLRARESFILAAGVGDDAIGLAAATSPLLESQLVRTLESSTPVIVRDFSSEDGSSEHELLAEYGVASSISLAIPGEQSPAGVISAYSNEPRHFGYADGVFLQAIANILAGALARFRGEERIRHQALHDGVTGLANRTLLEDRLRHALTSARRHNRRLAVLFLDINNFKWINDSLGHALGDQVLKAVAERLQGALRAEDTLARFGGDEFVVLLPEIEDDDAWKPIVERITSSLESPLDVNGRQIVTTVSIGIALGGAGLHLKDAQALIRDADLAMYAAKQRGPSESQLFAEHMYDAAVQRLDLAADLYNAIEHQELAVHYQPIVALNDESIVGLEALVRWNHPKHGVLSPAMFLPLAEETGLIVPMGRYVLRTACEQVRAWQLSHPQRSGLYVTVNLCRQELVASDLVAEVEAVLRETELDPATLVLEITEGALLTTDETIISRLHELKKLGVKLAVDDFGTGYSSLSSLQRFKLDLVKIDKSFIDGLGDADQDRLVKGIIELAHGVDLKTVAEGVESSDQAEALRGLKSELGQGFLFARPLTSEAVEQILSPLTLVG
jgi:diguanylate cyclase (GGDEF)-like protein/PAS domain S-box-containing protein